MIWAQKYDYFMPIKKSPCCLFLMTVKVVRQKKKKGNKTRNKMSMSDQVKQKQDKAWK